MSSIHQFKRKVHSFVAYSGLTDDREQLLVRPWWVTGEWKRQLDNFLAPKISSGKCAPLVTRLARVRLSSPSKRDTKCQPFTVRMENGFVNHISQEINYFLETSWTDLFCFSSRAIIILSLRSIMEFGLCTGSFHVFRPNKFVHWNTIWVLMLR